VPTQKTTRSARRRKPGKNRADISRPFIVLVGSRRLVSCKGERVSIGLPVPEDHNFEICGPESCVGWVATGRACALCPACAAILGDSEAGGPPR